MPPAAHARSIEQVGTRWPLFGLAGVAKSMTVRLFKKAEYHKIRTIRVSQAMANG